MEIFGSLVGIGNSNLTRVRGRKIQPFNDRPLYFVCSEISTENIYSFSNGIFTNLDFRETISLCNSGIIILETLADFPYIIRSHSYSEQSPVNILSNHTQYKYLPVLRYYNSFADMIITSVGHTGIKS